MYHILCHLKQYRTLYNSDISIDFNNKIMISVLSALKYRTQNLTTNEIDNISITDLQFSKSIDTICYEIICKCIIFDSMECQCFQICSKKINIFSFAKAYNLFKNIFQKFSHYSANSITCIIRSPYFII